MSNILDSVKRTVMGDKANDNTSTAHDSSYGPGGASTQRSNFATTGDHDVTGVHNQGIIPKQTDVAGNAKHNNKGGSVLGKMTDPRGEFDKDTQVGGAGSRHMGTGTTTGAGTYGSTNSGPHNSNVANKLDPRVDSDRDGRANPHSSVGGAHGSTTAGPHNSNIANKLDPRVDSDRDGKAAGFGSTTHGSTKVGPHNTNTANKMDPRIDSDRDGRAGGFGSTTHGSTTAGPHNSNIANKLDPRVDSDRDGKSGAFGSTTHGSTNAGPHNSDIANKLDPRVDSDRDGHGHGQPHYTVGPDPGHTNILGHQTHTGATNAGPHSSDAANKMDPRVDSDRDGRSGAMGMGSTTHGSTNVGPHNSNVANKLDPRVDSDRDGRANPTSSIGNTHRGATSSGMGVSKSDHQTSTAGPHSSNVANKLDPRVDSDRDHRANPGSNVGGTGTGHKQNVQNVSSMIDGPTIGNAGANTTHNTHGPHNSKMANKADPRVDSDRDHRANPASNIGGTNKTTAGTTHHGPGGLGTAHKDGPAPNTAGPHKSDLLNKLDPRVDSDRDGSKTIGNTKY